MIETTTERVEWIERRMRDQDRFLQLLEARISALEQADDATPALAYDEDSTDCLIVFDVIVYGCYSQIVINVHIQVYNDSGNLVQDGYNDDDGRFVFCLPAAGGYSFVFTAVGYTTNAFAQYVDSTQPDTTVVLVPALGYNGSPEILFSGGGGSGATGYVTAGNAIITANGTGYATPPDVGFAGDGAGMRGFSILGVLKAIPLVNSGTNYSPPPTVTITPGGTAAVGVATFDGGYFTKDPESFTGEGFTVMLGQALIGASVTSGGGGYGEPPIAAVQKSDGSFLSIGTGIISGGAVIGVKFTAGSIAGGGYSGASYGGFVTFFDGISTFHGDFSMTCTLFFLGGRGRGATAVAVVGKGTDLGKITKITITNPGIGYFLAPTIGLVPIASGSGATALAVVDPTGVSGVTITDLGWHFACMQECGTIILDGVITDAWGPLKLRYGGTALGTSGATRYVQGNAREVGPFSQYAPGVGPSYPYYCQMETFTGYYYISYSIFMFFDTAKGTTVLSGGSVASVTITNPGSRYLAAPTVTFLQQYLFNADEGDFEPAGMVATGHAIMDTMHPDQVASVVIDDPGSGYVDEHRVSFSPPEVGTPALTVNGPGVQSYEERTVAVSDGSLIYLDDPDYFPNGDNLFNKAGTVHVTVLPTDIQCSPFKITFDVTGTAVDPCLFQGASTTIIYELPSP